MQGGASCCPPGSWPALKIDYQPKGAVFQLPNGQKMYRVGEGKRALVILSDIFGVFNGRHQAVADTMASWGYNVYVPEVLPELYEGDVVVEKLMPYLHRQDQKKVRENWTQARAALDKDGHKHFFLVGVCWGAWKAWQYASEDEGVISIVGFHPSIVIEKIIGGEQAEAELAKKQRCPSLLLPAGNDPENIKAGGQLVKILAERFGEKVVTVEYPEMAHGWVTRGDLNDEKVKRDTNDALERAKTYLDSFTL